MMYLVGFTRETNCFFLGEEIRLEVIHTFQSSFKFDERTLPSSTQRSER